MPQYHASCHCGAVQYDVDLELQDLATCNCSMCGRTGAIMRFVPRAQISNLIGEEKLTDYQFGGKTIHHVFCSVCGGKPLAFGRSQSGEESVMVNVRCLQEVDAHTLTVAHLYDGKNF